MERLKVYREKRIWSNAKSSNYNGYIYQSKFEAGYARDLDLLQKAGEIQRWEKQVNIPLIVNGYEVCKYKIDFIVYHNDGIKEYIECKGIAFPVWRLKWKLFEAIFGDLVNVKLTVIKQKNNWNMRRIKKVKYEKKDMVRNLKNKQLELL
jgi:hypothetical protein